MSDNESNESRETVADIVAAMRAMARVSETFMDRFSNPCLRTMMEMEAKMRKSLADRIEAAVDRERRQYQKLHDCFWDKGAVQCIIRRMRDSRDDLARAYPEAARELDYYADELIRARCDRAAGNAAALRKAVDWPCERMADMDATFDPFEVECLCAAHSAPARNCDRFADETDAQLAFLNEVWLISVDRESMLERDRYENWTDEMRARYGQWLLAPAAQEGGAAHHDC